MHSFTLAQVLSTLNEELERSKVESEEKSRVAVEQMQQELQSMHQEALWKEQTVHHTIAVLSGAHIPLGVGGWLGWWMGQQN